VGNGLEQSLFGLPFVASVQYSYVAPIGLMTVINPYETSNTYKKESTRRSTYHHCFIITYPLVFAYYLEHLLLHKNDIMRKNLFEQTTAF